MTEQEQGFDLHAAAEEIIGNEPQSDATPEIETASGDTQETESQETQVESKELSPEEILAKLGEEKETPVAGKEILDQINALGAIHNGQPVKIENVDQLKELIQKGYDYTKKTMSLAEESKVFNEEKTKYQAELKQHTEALLSQESSLAETIYENQIAEAVLSEMKNSDPDLFEEFRQRYNRESSRRNEALNNPYMKQFNTQLQGLSGELQSLKQQKVQAELSGIKQGWEKELTSVQTKFAPIFSKLGVKADWAKVQKAWSSDASNSLTVEAALDAVHGADIRKAYESYNKLLATKNKTNTSMLKRTGVGSGQGSKQETVDFGGNYEAYLRANA